MIEKIAREILNSQISEDESIYVEKLEDGIFFAGVDSTSKGLGKVIIGEDYTFLYGDSNIGMSQLLEKFKNGERSNYKLKCLNEEGEDKMNEEFKINKNISFKDEETKKAYLEFLNEVNEYNKKVANGERPEHDISYYSDKFEKTFEIDDKENIHYENDNSKKLEELLDSIDKKLGIKDDDSNIDNLIEKIDNRIAMLESEERFDTIQYLISKICIEENEEMKKIIFSIVKDIDDKLNDVETNIAKIINYDPETKFIEPLEQGKILNYVRQICDELNITLVRKKREFGGLAFYSDFIINK